MMMINTDRLLWLSLSRPGCAFNRWSSSYPISRQLSWTPISICINLVKLLNLLHCTVHKSKIPYCLCVLAFVGYVRVNRLSDAELPNLAGLWRTGR